MSRVVALHKGVPLSSGSPYRGTVCALVLAAMLVSGCSAGEAQPTTPVATGAGKKPNDDALLLQQVVDGYFDQYLALHPLRATEIGDHRFDDRFGDYASPSWMADSLGIEQESLEKLAAVDPRRLRGEQWVTYDAFKRQRELNIGGYRYPTELLAIDPFASPAEEFALLGSGRGAHPFRTARDYENFLARMDGFVAWVDQSINNLRAGVSKGMVLPEPVVARILPQLEAIGRIENPRESPFWQPLLNFPAGPAVADRRRLLEAYDLKLRDGVLPAYRRLHDYLAREYLPVARKTVSWAALPGGDYWYAYLVRYYTGSAMTPLEAQEFGTTEVARLRGDVERLKGAIGLTGSLAEAGEALRTNPDFRPATASQLLDAYARAQARVSSRLPGLFARPLTTGLGIRAVESDRAEWAPDVSYRPAAVEDKRPGVLYVNTHDLAARPTYLAAARYLEQAIPGRHYEATIAQQTTSLPRLRRFGEIESFGAGWTAYAATLGRELGLYDGDIFSQFGALELELTRAATIVVDTGLHLQGWPRERAIEYLRAQTLMSSSEIERVVDRCIAEPAAALAAPIGARRIATLRRKAEKELGPRFDVRQFHDQVIGGGAMPWPTLEAKMNRWIASQK